MIVTKIYQKYIIKNNYINIRKRYYTIVYNIAKIQVKQKVIFYHIHFAYQLFSQVTGDNFCSMNSQLHFVHPDIIQQYSSFI